MNATGRIAIAGAIPRRYDPHGMPALTAPGAKRWRWKSAIADPEGHGLAGGRAGAGRRPIAWCWAPTPVVRRQRCRLLAGDQRSARVPPARGDRPHRGGHRAARSGQQATAPSSGRLAVKEVTLASGAEIRVGTSTLRFEMGGEEGRLAPPGPAAPARAEELAEAPSRFGPALGGSPAMRRLFALLARLAPTELTVTLTGETGTGKDVLARAIHQASPRAQQPFVVFDCGAVAPIADRERAVRPREGRLHRGGGRPPGRVRAGPQGARCSSTRSASCRWTCSPSCCGRWSTAAVRRVGGGRGSARSTCASWPPPTGTWRIRCASGLFREDLFFRLMAATLHVPPLRERKEDLPQLVTSFPGRGRQVTGGGPRDAGDAGRLRLAGQRARAEERRRQRRRAGRRPDAGAPPSGGVPTAAASAGGGVSPPLGTSLPLAGQTLEQLEKAAIEQALQQLRRQPHQGGQGAGHRRLDPVREAASATAWSPANRRRRAKKLLRVKTRAGDLLLERMWRTPVA